MLPARNSPSQATGKNDGFQVLNISNVNAQNEVVLNDEILLALIQQYPFLYNPHVRPHNDEDYDAWAWEQITKAFNRTYENLNRGVWYSTDELIERWKVLQPIVRSLSKINNMKSLPDTLRQTVVKMSVPMEEKPNVSHAKPLTMAQKTLLEYEPLVKSLSLADRRRLEAEMMELILNSELDAKATIKVGSTDLQTIENDYNDFLKSIGLDEIYMEENNRDKLQINQNYTNPSSKTNGVTFILEVNKEKPNIPENENCRLEKSFTSDSTLQVEETENNLLKPLVNKRWVPLNRWHEYVRKCRVRVKRYVMEEDDLPLSVIKREKLETNYILPN